MLNRMAATSASAVRSDKATPVASLDFSLERLNQFYTRDQQAELLVLQAEAESLLCQIRTHKAVRSDAP